MLELQDIATFCYGAAAVMDAALLLVLLERRNWRRVAPPLLVLIAGTFVFHGAAFINILMRDLTAADTRPLHATIRIAMAFGLAILPCAILHILWRLQRKGFETQAPPDRRALLIYLPVLSVLPIAAVVWAAPQAPFLQTVHAYVTPYVAFLLGATVITALGCLRLRARFSDDGQGQLLTLLAVALLSLGGFLAFVFFVGVSLWPGLYEHFVLVATLAPVVLALVLGYSIMRYQFMQLVLRRSVLYGALVVAAVLLHRLVLQEIWNALGQRYHLDFAMLEGALLIALILLYRPLRERAAEALHYLLGERIAETRDLARRLALEMSAMFDAQPQAVLSWFCESIAGALKVEYLTIYLLDDDGRPGSVVGDSSRLEASAAVAAYRVMAKHGISVCHRSDAPTRELAATLAAARASMAVTLTHPNVVGLLVFGERPNHRELIGEQLNAVLMLVEQLGITLNNSRLQAARLSAERRALQNEKLSTLGLVASSLAHEVKNPLSSIKTITTVMAEDLGADNPHSQDLSLVRGEIDRLSHSVEEILKFARPAQRSESRASPHEAMNGTLRIMRHVAKQHDVTLDVRVAAELPHIDGEENALREVFFNLLKNAIAAAGVGGTVTVAGRHDDGTVVVDVADDGPGIPPELQDTLFEPFTTAAEGGTGLGLYVVSRRLHEMGGEIRCTSSPQSGTLFSLTLPVSTP